MFHQYTKSIKTEQLTHFRQTDSNFVRDVAAEMIIAYISCG